MAQRVLVVESEPPERALVTRRATGATAARRFAARLRRIAPDLEVEIAQPYFSDHDPAALDPGAFDGAALTGADVGWAADDARAGPILAACEAILTAGTPLWASGWGMQVAAVALGGAVGPAPKGLEAGIARGLRPVGAHPMTLGRRDGFDAPTMHDAEVLRPPPGAVVTATNDHSAIQAFALEQGGAEVWAAQYRPEAELTDIAAWLSASGRGAEARDVALVAQDPVAHARLLAKRRIGLDLLDERYRTTELANWLRRLAARSGPAY